jgi:hypothetical protein
MAVYTGSYNGHRTPSRQITAVLVTLARAHTRTPVSSAYITRPILFGLICCDSLLLLLTSCY